MVVVPTGLDQFPGGRHPRPAAGVARIRPGPDSYLSALHSDGPGSDDGADPWAWVLEEGEEPRLDVSQLHVTAVLVAFDAARWLPATLDALARLEHRPNRLIAIDNDSTDATRTLLEQARDQGIVDAVYSGKRTYGFGQAVKSALRQDRRATSGQLDDDAPTTCDACPGSAPRTGSGCCTTTRRRHRTRSTGCSRT